MTSVFFDKQISDQDRRIRLYGGDLFVYSPTKNSVDFCSFARDMIVDAFGDSQPETAQHRLPVSDYVQILQKLKPEFIHHPESKKFVRSILKEFGCDLEETYFDVPRMRSSTSDDYLTTGIAYAWHPHRDVWYSAPSTQINFWIPISDIESENTIMFHPPYFDKHVPNDSKNYNYYEWNKKYRAAAASQTKKETRPLPGPTNGIELDSQIRVVCPVGGIILFSAAQLHSSVPNSSGKTRFSIDFRTVNLDDIQSGSGAPMQDVNCTGSNIRDFLQVKNFTDMPEKIVELFNDGSEDKGDLVFAQNKANS